MGNFSDGNAGGMSTYLERAALLIEESVISGNSAAGTAGGLGVTVYQATSIIVRSTISGNMSGNDGGVVAEADDL